MSVSVAIRPKSVLSHVDDAKLEFVNFGVVDWRNATVAQRAAFMRDTVTPAVVAMRVKHGFAARFERLLTPPDANHKFEMTDAPTFALTLAMAASSGIVNTCPWAGDCRKVCVLTNGNGAYPAVQRARNWKTEFLIEHSYLFGFLLASELGRLAPGTRVRLNAASDIRWERVYSLFTTFPELRFYDYSKSLKRATASASDPTWPTNYRVVYSVSERSDADAVATLLASGGFAAIVTDRKKGTPTLSTWRGFPVVDGDVTDDLWRLAAGTLTDLSAKGRARTMGVGGFVKHLASF